MSFDGSLVDCNVDIPIVDLAVADSPRRYQRVLATNAESEYLASGHDCYHASLRSKQLDIRLLCCYFCAIAEAVEARLYAIVCHNQDN
jgi:hypothetical protein